VQLSGRLHFFAVAAELMRRVLVDHARKHGAAKRGGSHLTVTLEEDLISAKQREIDILALDDALNQLAQMDTQQSRIIELRFFGGLSIEQTARALGISPATVKRDWAVARTWLYRELSRTTDAR
jgi:RNA polymerase sigma factor (TIGR02999 family)